MDALNANGKTQLFTNLVWRSNAHTAVRKTSSERERKKKKRKKKKKKKEKKIFFYIYIYKTKKEKTKNKKTNKKQTKKWGTGAVQDKPFDELLMFIVDKDSALFSGL